MLDILSEAKGNQQIIANTKICFICHKHSNTNF